MRDVRNQELAATRESSYEPPQAVRLNEAGSGHGACVNVGNTDISCADGGGATNTCLAGINTVGCLNGIDPIGY
jgi:hypothetical protein